MSDEKNRCFASKSTLAPNDFRNTLFYNLGLCLRFQSTRSRRREEAQTNQSAIGNRQSPIFQSLLTPAATNFDDDYAAFYKATWNQAWAAAGYHALAEMDCCRKEWATALEHLSRSLRFNTDNLRARNLKVLVLRKLAEVGVQASACLGEGVRPDKLKLELQQEAAALLRETLALDPLDWWARQLNGEKIWCDLQAALDLAHDFARAGFYAEAVELLGARASARFNDRKPIGYGSGVNAALPDQSWGALPLVHYTLGWLHARLADPKIGVPKTALAHYQTAAVLPPDYCFPSRLEEIVILEAAMRANPKDAKAPYYLGNLLYDRRRHNEAIRLWEKSAKLDGNFSIVWRNLGIGYFNIRKNAGKARTVYDQAFRVNPCDARLLYERDQLWKRLGEKPAMRLRELEKHPDLIQQRDDLSVELCALLNQTGRHVEAMQLLARRNFQPWEGGEGGPLGQHVRTQLAFGHEALQSADSSRREEAQTNNSALRTPHSEFIQSLLTSAATHFEKALTAPQNLGEAKHLLTNQSDIHYWLGCACEALREKQKAKQHWRIAANFKGDFQAMSVRAFSEMTYHSAPAWEKLGQPAKAKKLLRDLLAYAQKLQKSEAKIDYFATSLPTMLIFDDDLQFRQETSALFLQAQAQLGLGRKMLAKKLLQKVLQRDPNHAFAADLAAELFQRKEKL